MKSSVVSKLVTLINENGSEEAISAFEDVIVESIDESVEEDVFFTLPTTKIIEILGKSSIESTETLIRIVSKMSENKKEESPLLLNVIDREDATFDECVRIISNFIHCPLCKRISQFNEENASLPTRDYDREIEDLQRENEELKKSKNDTFFPPVTEKPTDFERDICKAAREGKLSSVQYLVEQCHSDVETKDEYGWTPINNASENGHLEVVKYLYEKCHSDVETKNEYGFTPINRASCNGHLEVVKYLYEKCHSDVETKDNGGLTPINSASCNGHLEVVKYLYEKCHAKITDETIRKARNKTIRKYLQFNK